MTTTIQADKLQLFYVQEPLYFTQLALTKISVLFLYLRIFPSRRFRLITYAFMAFIAVSTAGLVFLAIFECLPVGYFWEAWETEYLVHSKKCFNLTLGAFGSAGLSILEDIIMITLPIPPLLKTRISIKEKVGISTLFILGLLITVASCVRLRFINVAYSPNPFWDYEPAMLWSLVELAISFLVTSLPALSNYYTQRVQPRMRAYIETRRSGKASQDSSASARESHVGPNWGLRTARRTKRRGNSNMISTLAFTNMSWGQLGDRRPTSQSTDKLPSVTDSGDIDGKSETKFSLRYAPKLPELQNLPASPLMDGYSSHFTV